MIRAPTDWRIMAEAIFGCDAATVEYLVHVLPRLGLVYFEIPKVASTTLKASLANLSSGEPARKLSDYPFEADEVLFSSNFKRCAFVRNPYTRILSAYLEKIVQDDEEWRRLAPQLELTQKPTFREFLIRLGELDPVWIDVHFRSQFNLLRPDVVPFDFVGRFEQLGRDFIALQAIHLGHRPEATVELENRAAHASHASAVVAEYFDPPCANLAYRLFERDFDQFRYPRALPRGV